MWKLSLFCATALTIPLSDLTKPHCLNSNKSGKLLLNAHAGLIIGALLGRSIERYAAES
jgi:hypothetical protein